MKWFANLRIRSKLLIGFGISILFSIIMSAEGCIAVTQVNNNYAYLVQGPQERLQNLMSIQTDFMTMRYRAANFAMNSGDLDVLNNTVVPQYGDSYQSLLRNLDEYVEHNTTDTRRDPAIIRLNDENAKKLRNLVTEYDTAYVSDVRQFSFDNNFAAADARLKDAIPISGQITELVTEMLTPVVEYKEEVIEKTAASTRNTIVLNIALSFLLLLIAVTLAVFIGSYIAKSLQNLGASAKKIAEGNLELSLASNTRDEIGDLSRDLCSVVDTLNKLTLDMDTMASDFDKGDIEAKIDESLFQGSYKTVAEGVNTMMHATIAQTIMFLNCMTEFSKGNFDANIPPQPGKKVLMNNVLDEVRVNIKSVAGDIAGLVGDSVQGKLSNRADVSKYRGGWADIMKDLNNLMDAVVAPIQEAADILQNVSKGNFDKQVTGQYQGDFQIIKDSLNNTIINVSSYIEEISSVLNALANGDLDQGITRHYEGKFSEIKESLNSIIEKFNHVISEIASAASQVSTGARQISESSMLLAQGATEQASAVEELNATTHVINESTAQNADSAKQAESLSKSSMQNAAKGDQDMNNMLVSMEGIKESSNSISKIIKVIDDIAFQTNLLALNAAVEAARAGIHGKGFAVVAEEVRNLAGRSQSAAKETAELIEESISRVNDGTKIAGMTANALQTIVSDVTKVADIISNIAAASQQQTMAIRQVTEGVSQITEVVQSNSATSEESAASSEELSGQATTLQNLVGIFQLKKGFRG